MFLLYRIVSALIYFILWPYARFRALFESTIWRDRLGLIGNVGPVEVWIHAASVGETKIAGYLIAYLYHQQPNLRIYLSTMTSAGQKKAESLRSDRVRIGYFPIDSNFVVKKYIDQVRPKMLIVAETEIWPNLVENCSCHGIPIVLVNGRMSDKAFRKYKIIRKMMAALLSKYERVFVKSSADREKFRYFNLSDNKIVIAGNMKFDAPILSRSQEHIRATRRSIGANNNDFVLVAGSTRPGEEELLIQLVKLLTGESVSILLVIAPRHPNRMEEIKAALAMRQVPFAIYGFDNGSSPITLVDKMGQLDELYQAADLAFVGGTLVNVGGHNILEPVWAGTPVVFGPYVNNILDSKNYILEHNYGAMVNSIEEMGDLVKGFMRNRQMFARKSDEELAHSPTAIAGDYILERIAHA